MLQENHFTKDAYEDNGRFQIHPLNAEGLEAYLSKDSYNYHYLKSKYDPALLKQIEEELKEQRQIKNKQLNKNENENKIIENNQKIEDIKETKNNTNINAKKSPDKKNNNVVGTNKANNNKINKKGNTHNNHNNIKKKENINTNKIKNIGHATKPVISTVKNDRGRLKDFQQPYQG